MVDRVIVDEHAGSSDFGDMDGNVTTVATLRFQSVRRLSCHQV